VSYQALARAPLMENFLRQKNAIRQGAYYGSSPASLAAPICATRDVAAAAARLLVDRSWSGVDSVPMLGPEDLSHTAMMAIMSEVLARPVAYHEISIDDLRRMTADRGASKGMVQAMINMAIAKNEGMDSLEPRTVTNDSPTTFRRWCELVLLPALEA
jgi:uncharacterized protein YbjT (DUF2867 family)